MAWWPLQHNLHALTQSQHFSLTIFHLLATFVELYMHSYPPVVAKPTQDFSPFIVNQTRHWTWSRHFCSWAGLLASSGQDVYLPKGLLLYCTWNFLYFSFLLGALTLHMCLFFLAQRLSASLSGPALRSERRSVVLGSFSSSQPGVSLWKSPCQVLGGHLRQVPKGFGRTRLWHR